MAKLIIGMPVYNNAGFVDEAIKSLINQTYTDWMLLISDNASTDGTSPICEGHSCADPRIIYFRQSENIGGVLNFRLLLDMAIAKNAKYFMWAASDDLWESDFLIACIDNLENNKSYGMAFTNIVNIDSFGQVIREYPDFSRFAGPSKFINIARYLSDPEIMGKANLFYSVYRLEVCRQAWEVMPPEISQWGSDMCFVLAALARTRIVIDERALFKKRFPRPTDRPDMIDRVNIGEIVPHTFPLAEAQSYMANNLRATRRTKYYLLTKAIMKYRVWRVVSDSVPLRDRIKTRIRRVIRLNLYKKI